MKKLLTLLLCAAMLFSLCVPALAAELAVFADANEVENTQAMAYLVDAGFITGVEQPDGTALLDPDAPLTREQAAKLVAYTKLGADAANLLTVSAAIFDDVDNTRWSAGYINYCASAGILAGDGTGKFNPSNDVTGYEMGKMLLCALGYGKLDEFVGAGWKLNTIQLAQKTGLLDDAADPDASLTRDNAAQLIFRGTKAETVILDEGTKTYEGTGHTLAGDVYGAPEMTDVCYVNYAADSNGKVNARIWRMDGTTELLPVYGAPENAADLIGLKRCGLTESDGVTSAALGFYDASENAPHSFVIASGSVSVGKDMELRGFSLAQDAVLFVHRGSSTIDKYEGADAFPAFSHSASVTNAVFCHVNADGELDRVFVLNHVDVGGVTVETIYARDMDIDDEEMTVSFNRGTLTDGEFSSLGESFDTLPITAEAAKQATHLQESPPDGKVLDYYILTVTNGTITAVDAEYTEAQN